jgi:hypothetical protein
MPPKALRITFLVLSLLALLIASVDSSGASQKSMTLSSYTITLTQGSKVVVSEASLTVELIEIDDRRCSAEKQCYWEGPAAVTLQVSKVGDAPKTVIIRNEISTDTKPPLESSYGSYGFHLIRLEPAYPVATPVAATGYRAIVQISNRDTKRKTKRSTKQ